MSPKNSQLHFFLETKILHILKEEAYEEGVTLSELCRRKLRESCKFTKMELLTENIYQAIQNLR